MAARELLITLESKIAHITPCGFSNSKGSPPGCSAMKQSSPVNPLDVLAYSFPLEDRSYTLNSTSPSRS